MINQPLAYRMSPMNLDEFVGQKHIVGQGKLLRRLIESDRLRSVIFYGPSGSGKTALARIISNMTQLNFVALNAVTCGIADIKQLVSDTQNQFLNPKGRSLLFLDEIHRFNKAQQDSLLPHIENGTIILIGATTENPYFEVNKALISRSTVFMLNPLETEDILKILTNALTDKEKGLGNFNVEVSDESLQSLATASNGDARIALNALELAVITSKPRADGKILISVEDLKESIQNKSIRFDKNAQEHYDNISAFIKSMRGSDPDATLHYLAKLLLAGEDINFIARRIMICAAEDVGLANPQALVQAEACASAVRMIGMPEAALILSQAALYIAISHKSNSAYLGIKKAMDDVKNIDTGEIPMWLRNAPIEDMKDLGYGKGYKYAHDFENNYVDLQYLPDKIKDKIYFEPSEKDIEGTLLEWIKKRKKS